MKYFYICNKEKECTNVEAILDGPIQSVSEKLLAHAKELPFAFKICSPASEPVYDFLADNKAINIFSEKIMKILAEYNENTFEWVKVKVYKQKEVLNFYTTRFTEIPDLLNYEKCIYGAGKNVIGPCFDEKKIMNFKNIHLFCYKPRHCGLGATIVVSEKIKKELVNNGITGMLFERAKVE